MRLPFRCLPLVGLVLGCLAMPAAAVTVEDLHTARVEVAGKGEEARRTGFREALERVLIRVSGTAAVADNPDVEALLASPSDYVQQFRYEALEMALENGEAPDAGEADAGGDEERPTHRLIVTFTGSRIDRALSEQGVPVWGAQRPEVLVWLAVDDGDRRYLVSADGDSAAHSALVETGRERGLPLLLPLMDTEDRGRVEFVDIRGGFFDAVRAASERYRAETLLVGHVERRGSRWVGDWTLLGLGDRRSWRATGGALAEAIGTGVGGATERVAATLAGRTGERTTVDLRILGVDGLAGYARLAEYLDSLVRVREAEVVAVRSSEAVFRLDVQGSVADLERALALGNMLRKAEAPGLDETDAMDGSGSGGASGGSATTAGERDAAATGSDGGPADVMAPGGLEGPGLVYRLAG